MSISAFPSNWHIEDGIIGQDVDSSTTSLSGGTTIRLKASPTTNAKLYTQWYKLPDPSVAGGSTSATGIYSVAATLQASSSAVGDDVSIRLEFANSDKSTIIWRSVYSGPVQAANTWETFGKTDVVFGSNESWVRLRFDRPTNTNFDVLVDHVEIKQLPSGGSQKTVSGGSFTSAWSRIPFVAVSSTGYTAWNSSNNWLELHSPGRYSAIANVILTGSYSAGDMFGVRIAAGPNPGVLSYWYCSLAFPAAYNAATNPIGISCAASFITSNLAASTAGRYHAVALEIIQYNGTGGTYDEAKIDVSRITDR